MNIIGLSNKKMIKFGFLTLFSFLWFLGFSEDFAKWLALNKVIPSDYRYGDLYRMSNLAQFKVPLQKCNIPETTESNHTSLILLGDSFTENERIEKNHFKGLDNYQRFFITDTIRIKIDTTKRNILIIETVERHFRERFVKPYMNLQLVDNESDTGKIDGRSILERIIKGHIPYSAERHESVLFSSNFFLTFKEWKAWVNWHCFNRVDKNVMLSKDKKHILYYADAQSSGIHSSFDKISDNEVTKMVENLNLTYQHYKKLGFDEVYLTIAPNKTSILGTDLGKYNHLIDRIQQHSSLKMPFFDVYTPFKKSKKMLYDIGDTHWNCDGKQIWLDEVNEKL